MKRIEKIEQIFYASLYLLACVICLILAIHSVFTAKIMSSIMFGISMLIMGYITYLSIKEIKN